ncbi:MAG: N-acetylglucosamine kinase [Bacteroidota bacterium]
MPSLLLAESGSTKTDWCLLKKNGKPIHFKTSGINPYIQKPEEIEAVLKTELKWDPKKHSADAIYYYGAGASHTTKQKEVAGVLKKFFGIKKVEVQSDMMAAARSLCGNQKGMVSILGTGSNSCYYNGKTIAEQHPSLGYIAGDEGSGNYMGKQVLRYYAYNTFDTELRMAFEQHFGDNIAAILHKLYGELFPNRHLAEFVRILKENRGHFMVENIIEDCLNDFFQTHILKYRQTWKSPLHFAGSVAYEFRDVIASICQQYELELGNIVKSPLDGLITYHKQSLA